MNELKALRPFDRPSSAVYRAYMKGLSDAASGQRDTLIPVLAAMLLGFLCWSVMMFFLFK